MKKPDFIQISPVAQADTGHIKTAVIVGLPNTGKSQLFNNLTGTYTVVANYPLTTIEPKRVRCQMGGRTWELIDTPGVHCFSSHSEEELCVRNIAFSEKPDVIIQCVDASHLKQSLVLTADLLEMATPLVLSLNKVDVSATLGLWIDSVELSRLLDVPVVESVASRNRGTQELRDALDSARTSDRGVRYGDMIEEKLHILEAGLPAGVLSRRKASALMLMQDSFLADSLQKEYGVDRISGLREDAARAGLGLRGDPDTILTNRRNRWVDGIAAQVSKAQGLVWGRDLSRTLGHLSRHPVYGIPILLSVVAVAYLLVVEVANGIAGWMDQMLWQPLEHQIRSVVPGGFWTELLVGDYGVLSLGLANAFMTVLPILSVFFVFFSILEDVGYMPNLSVLVKRVFSRVGLSGAAVMPLVLGLGCKTMATLTTRTLESRRERYIAIYLIAFALPCAPQMALNMSILGRMGALAFAIAFSALAIAEIGVGMALNRILKQEQRSDLIQVLPPMRVPSVRAVLTKTYYRLYWFVKEAVPVFVYASAVLFAIDRIGVLGAMKEVLKPVMQGFLGLPVQMVDALILCMARHEAAAGMIIKLVEQGELNWVQCIVSVTLTTMFVPCFANIVAMIQEQGARSALAMVAMINGSAFVLAGCLNWLLLTLTNG